MEKIGIRLNRQIVKHVFASVDFGFVNPGCIQVWLVVGSDDTMVLICEVYRTQRTIDWWIAKAKELSEEFKIEVFVCDSSEPSFITQFNEAGLPAVKAINDIAPGISALQSRLQIGKNGRPRLYVYEYALRERDELRDEAHQPVWFEGEINEYVWPKGKDGQAAKEVPVKLNDHSMDAARYAVMHLERASIGVTDTDRDTLAALRRYRGYQ
jgi:hypothetical protein